jgi:hypothetical protein
MFCSSDGKLVCSSCLIGTHRGLEVEEINVAVDRIRASIETKVESLLAAKHALQTLSENLSIIRTDLRLDSDHKQNAITKATEELRNLLDKKEEEMCHHLHFTELTMKTSLQKQYLELYSMQQDMKRLSAEAVGAVGPLPSAFLEQVKFLKKWAAMEQHDLEKEIDDVLGAFKVEEPVVDGIIPLNIKVNREGMPPHIFSELDKLQLSGSIEFPSGECKEEDVHELEKRVLEAEKKVETMELELNEKKNLIKDLRIQEEKLRPT